MPIRYSRMHGAGNRIVVVDGRPDPETRPGPDLLERLADAGTEPGFDQLMWLATPRRKGSVASYRVFNSDGSEVEQCGNGVRCVAVLLADEAVGGRLELDSPAGRIDARLHGDGRVAVNMGPPAFEPRKIPFVAKQRAGSYDLDVGGETVSIAAVSMGNPHCVIDVDDVASAPVATLGPGIETHDRFPQRVNVGFRHIRGRREIDLRVWERGAGETLACGTGACAAVVAGRAAAVLDSTVTVNLPGGQLVVSWRGPGEPVWLTGSAELIEEGTLEP